MKKYAVFTEGQTELIFVRNLVANFIFNHNVSFNCYKLIKGDTRGVPYDFKNPSAKAFFLIINVQGDGGVLGAIKDREKKLIEDGYETILGLKDMYCEEYKSKVNNCVVEEISKKFIAGHESTIKKMNYPQKIKIFFSVMEVEAWFLSMDDIFTKLNPKLTSDFISQNIYSNFPDIDVEQIFHPANVIFDIFRQCNLKYKKHEDESELLTSLIENSDIEIALRKSASFRKFYQEIRNYNETSDNLKISS